ncbi:hypothetical protein M885DRAFT_623205 [Pelagophyceae sp. CCMP2097]|nr:hypothetical protein M885DRAFT_623205 [Pelagophyceae sp. CCMP2097]
MVLRGVLSKRAADGAWRPRAFELTDEALAYEERVGDEVRRATIPLHNVTAVDLDLDRNTLVVVETAAGEPRRHRLRPAPGVDAPSPPQWASRLRAAAGLQPAADAGDFLSLQSGEFVRVRGSLLKKGGSRAPLVTAFAALCRPAAGTRRNWNAREFVLNFEKGTLEYFEKGVLKGAVKLNARTTVTAPDAVLLRGQSKPSDEAADPLYFELHDTHDADGLPRAVPFSMRAPTRREFDEWVLSIRACVAGSSAVRCTHAVAGGSRRQPPPRPSFEDPHAVPTPSPEPAQRAAPQPRTSPAAFQDVERDPFKEKPPVAAYKPPAVDRPHAAAFRPPAPPPYRQPAAALAKPPPSPKPRPPPPPPRERPKLKPPTFD